MKVIPNGGVVTFRCPPSQDDGQMAARARSLSRAAARVQLNVVRSAADALGGAGDDGDLAVELSHESVFLLSLVQSRPLTFARQVDGPSGAECSVDVDRSLPVRHPLERRLARTVEHGVH